MLHERNLDRDPACIMDNGRMNDVNKIMAIFNTIHL